MGIKLDWEVESDGGWSEIGEDPEAIAARQRRSRALRNFGIGLLLMLVIGGGAVGYRLNEVGKQLQSDLESTISAETLALRIGDRRAYLDGQADIGEWVRIQDSTFADYQDLGSAVSVTGEIIEMDISSDNARVVLSEAVEGESYHVVWFYQRDNESGWQHVPPSAEFWGEQVSDDASYIHLRYYESDSEIAGLLKVRFASWADAACRSVACTQRPPTITLRVSPDPLAELDWAIYDTNTLIVPSPQLGRMRADGQLDPMLFEQIADKLAVYWANHLLDTDEMVNIPDDLIWLEDELTIWIRSQFTEDAPESTFFAPIAEAYTAQSVIPALITQVKNGESVVAAINSIDGVSESIVSEIGWDTYLAHRLRGEATLIAEGHPTEAAILYQDSERSEGEQLANFRTEQVAIPSTIEIVGVREANGILLADVRFAIPELIGRDTQLVYYRSFEAYRLVDDRWLHTNTSVEDLGATQVAYSEHFILNTYELDAPFVEGLLPYMESVYVAVAADLGIVKNGRTINLVVLTAFAHDGFVLAETPSPLIEELPGIITLPVMSPYIATRADRLSPEDYIKETATHTMVENLIADQVSPLPSNHPFALAFMRWEFDRLGYDGESLAANYLNEQSRISEAWPADGAGSLAFTPPYQDEDFLRAYAVLLVLVDRYGEEIIPTLLAQLPLSENADDWLLYSVGLTYYDIELEVESTLEALLVEK